MGMCQCNCTPFIGRLQGFPNSSKEKGVGLGGRVFHSGGGMGASPLPTIFFSTLPHQFFFRPISPWGTPHTWSPPSEKQHPPLKSESSFQKMIPKKPWKIGKLSSILVLQIKTTMEKDGRNPTRTWFSHLGLSNFCKKSETVC